MKMTFNKNLVVPIAALVVGTLAALFANSYIKSTIEDATPKAVKGETVETVVAKSNLPRGTKLSSENLAIRPVPKDWAHSSAVTPAQFGQVSGLELSMPANKGEQLIWSQIEGKKAPTLSARLTGGRRAVTVAVDDISSISGMLAPGDTIDLIANLRHAGRPTLVPVMQAVHVLATGTRVEQSSADGTGASRSYTTVTLDVTPTEARRIMAAREVGKVTALLRAPGDRQNTMLGMSDAYAELGLGSPNGSKTGAETVPVLAGNGDPRRYTVGAAPSSGNAMEEAMTKIALMTAMAEAAPARVARAQTASPTSAVSNSNASNGASTNVVGAKTTP